MEALRSSMGDTVKVLVTAVTNDRELTKKLCVAVQRLEAEEGLNRRGIRDASIDRPPPTQNDSVEDQVSVSQPCGVAFPRRLFPEASKTPVPAVLPVPLLQCALRLPCVQLRDSCPSQPLSLC